MLAAMVAGEPVSIRCDDAPGRGGARPARCDGCIAGAAIFGRGDGGGARRIWSFRRDRDPGRSAEPAIRRHLCQRSGRGRRAAGGRTRGRVAGWWRVPVPPMRWPTGSGSITAKIANSARRPAMHCRCSRSSRPRASISAIKAGVSKWSTWTAAASDKAAGDERRRARLRSDHPSASGQNRLPHGLLHGRTATAKADRPPELMRGKPRRTDVRRPAPEGSTRTVARRPQRPTGRPSLCEESRGGRMSAARRLRVKSRRYNRRRRLPVAFGRGDDVAGGAALGDGVGVGIAHRVRMLGAALPARSITLVSIRLRGGGAAE